MHKAISHDVSTSWLKELLRQCNEVGFSTSLDLSAGVATAKHENETVLRALQIANGNWFVRGDADWFIAVV